LRRISAFAILITAPDLKEGSMMSKAAILVLAALAWITSAYADTPPPPLGPLPNLVKPTAYRLQLNADPAKTDFSGHTEIDAQLAKPTRTIFLHGNGLRVSKAQIATANHATVVAKYTEVDDSGVARLDLPSELPAGKITLTFDYTTGFRTGAEGLFHAQVGDEWYAWTQMEPIDARRMFPGFDEPGFKTPFTITVTAPKSAKVFANTPETGTSAAGEMTTHRFAPTQPLPTYLVALGIGPFDVVEASVPPNAVRKQALPFRVIATKGQTARMQLAAAEGPKLLALLERYLGVPYPFEKLDMLASPNMGGAMENAGLIIQDDALMLLDKDAPVAQLRNFADVTAHEMAHQWFGDLVTPQWWTDIWLNESFAEWMGKKIGDQWRPDLGIAVTELEEAFKAMDTDSLGKGRPIRQPITNNRQIASAFDSITYQKGAQVLSMFESFLGREKFAQGVHSYLERYGHGNATADDFFRSLGETAGDPKIVAAMRTFTDQMGVPMVTVRQDSKALALSQKRYLPLGVAAQPAQTWKIPLCIAKGTQRSCNLLDTPTTTIAPPAGTQPLLPNASGAGYYRFRLEGNGWDPLIAASGGLQGREALVVADSVWADFAAGTGSFERVLAAARSLATSSERLAVVELGTRLMELAETALTQEQIPPYRKVMQATYAPRLAALGLDVRAGAYAKEDAEKQALRQSLLPLVALGARDPSVRSKLADAADAYLSGNTQALDPAFRNTAFSVAVQERGAPFMTKLRDALVKSSDPLFRQHAGEALGAADTPALGETAVQVALSPGVQSIEMAMIVLRAAQHPGARPIVVKRVDQDFKRMMESLPGFARPVIIRLFNGYCSPGDVERVDAYMQPKLKMLGGGELDLARAKERIGQCIALKTAKSAEIGAALTKAAM
jgi:aminopeptidase N